MNLFSVIVIGALIYIVLVYLMPVVAAFINAIINIAAVATVSIGMVFQWLFKKIKTAFNYPS